MAAKFRIDEHVEYGEVLSSSNIAQFLATQEWALYSNRDADQVWVNSTGDQISSLLLPRDRRLVDYTRRLSEALEVIGNIYGWTIDRIAEQVAAVHADMFFVRVDQSMSDGTIPLRQAASLLESIDQMVRSAALTAYNPRSSGRGRVPKSVQEFLDDDVRMGHTKRGSFIITVAARLDDRPGQTEDQELEQEPLYEIRELAEDTETTDSQLVTRISALQDQREADSVDGRLQSFTREVMTTLSRGLELTREVAGEQSNRRDLGDEEFLGMRLPIVQALSEIGDSEGLRALDMSFEWAPAEPAPQGLPTSIRMDRSVFGSLPSIEQRLAKTVDQRPESIIGPVVELRRPEEYEEGSGEIVIRAEVEGRLRRVTVPLSAEDYDLAIAAHLRKFPFSVSGTLGKRKNAWTLLDRIVVDRELLRSLSSRKI